MPGRNDPCPCGSGKKYKKCCALKEAVTVEEVYEEELERILQTFYDVYPLRNDYKDYGEEVDQWKKAVGQYFAEDMIEAITMDTFFFHKRIDIWQGYLLKTKKEIIRPSTLKVLESWNHPTMMVAKIVKVDDKYMVVQNILTDEVAYLRRESDKPIPLNVHVFCFKLLDGTKKGKHYLSVSSMIFFPKNHQSVFEKIADNFRAQEQLDEEAFWKIYSLSFWKELGVDGFDGGEFTDFEADVFSKVEQYLLDRNRQPQNVLDVLEDYVVERQPKARKAVAIAAGAIRFGSEEGLFEPVEIAVKDMAAEFKVSTSSLNKYYHELKEYYQEKN